MTNRKVSAVIVSRNNRDTLPKSLDGLEKQSFRNFDIYLMDDSSDGTEEFIKKNYPKVKFFNVDAGVDKKRNIAIRKSNSEYIITLDSDTILSKDWIKKAVEYMDSHKDVGICCGKLIGKNGLIDWAGGMISKSGGIKDIGHGLQDKEEYNKFTRIPVMTTASSIIRKKMIDDIGGFDETFFYDFEDADLGIRANFAEWKVIYNPDLKAIHFYHSTISKIDKKRESYIRFCAKRNRLLNLIKNFELKTLVLNSPYITLSLLYGMRKNFLISAKAYAWLLLNFGKVKESRKNAIKTKRINDRKFFDDIIDPLIENNRRNRILWFLRRIKSRHIKNITFFITARCNSRCKHCFYWKSLNRIKDLSLKKIELIFSRFNNIYAISLGGGEPFLREDIDDIVKLAKKYMNIKFVDIPTNCLIDITKKFEKMLKENPDVRFALHPSLDGLREEHDYIRGIKGNFDKAVNLIYKLAKLKKKYPNFAALAVNTVITSRNYKKMPEFIKFVKTLPVTCHVFEIIRGEHQNIVKQPQIEEIKKFSRIACEVYSYYRKKNSLGRKIFDNLRMKEVWRTQIRALEGGKWAFKCTAGETDFVIDSNGDAKICEMLPKIGSLLKNSLEELLKTNLAKKIIENRNSHKCDCTHNCNITSSMDCSFRNIFLDRIL